MRPAPRVRAARGATLIELLVALIALSVLAGLLVPAFLSASDLERVASTKLRLEEYRTALLRHWMDVQVGDPTTGPHALPEGLSGLLAAEPGMAGWKGPYIRVGEPAPLLDAWGAPLLYARAPGTPDLAVVLSKGANGSLESDVGALLESPDPQAGGDDLFVRATTRPTELEYAEDTEEGLGRAATAIRAYLARHDDAFPPSLAALVADGLIAAGELRDRWGHPLRYQYPLTSADGSMAYADLARVYSLGTNEADDGQTASSDDLVRIVRRRRNDAPIAFTGRFTFSGQGEGDPITITLANGTQIVLGPGDTIPITLRPGEPILVDGLQRPGEFCLEPLP